VKGRDKGADGEFVFAVKTTGVYCRPGCPARTPQEGNVVFFDSPQEAAEAGFRACRRCGTEVAERRADAVDAACRAIEAAEAAPDLRTLARAAGMSAGHFQRVFKERTGLTPKAYAMERRAERARRELGRSGSVTEAIYEAGFQANSRFYEQAGRMLGMRPKDFRRGGVGETIRFAVGECSLGPILVAASGRGICAILLGDDPAKLVEELAGRFPKAELRGGEDDFEKLVARVVGMVEAHQVDDGLPLDVRGTVFQRRVWQALRQIPAGETMTYTEIAEKLGKPRAVRAVAGACAANPLAVVIPCHRVVRIGGGLAGYRWGIERKRKLLGKEKGFLAES